MPQFGWKTWLFQESFELTLGLHLVPSYSKFLYQKKISVQVEQLKSKKIAST